MGNDKRTMGERIEDLLKQNNMTSKELSDKVTASGIKLSPATLSDIISDKDKGYSYKIFVEIAKQLNVSTDYLFGLTEISTPDTDVKNICEYTGLNENTVKTLHNRLAEWDFYIMAEYDCDINSNILKSKGYFDYDLKQYKELLSNFIGSDEFNEIIKCFFYDAIFLENTYSNGLEIAKGNLNKFKSLIEDEYLIEDEEKYYNDLLYSFVWWKDLLNSFDNERIYKDHRLNLFNIQEYITSYSKTLTNFDNLKGTIFTINQVLQGCNDDLSDYFKFMEHELDVDEWDDRSIFVNELIKEMKISIEAESKKAIEFVQKMNKFADKIRYDKED